MPDLFKDSVWGPLVKASLAQLFKSVPILGFGPIGWVVNWIVMKVASDIFDKMEDVIDLERISFNNHQLHNEYIASLMRLRLVEREKGLNSDEYKQAKELNKINFSKFVHFA